jgi:membrane fusion protein (multidrug efflux system)
VQATVANSDGRLQPGMFGTAELELPTVAKAVVVPLAALVYNPYGNAVYVVEPDPNAAQQLVVRQQFVQIGAKRGDLVVIQKGVAPGHTVVTAGQLKLRNGAAVVVNNTVAVAGSLTPLVTQP